MSPLEIILLLPAVMLVSILVVSLVVRIPPAEPWEQ